MSREHCVKRRATEDSGHKTGEQKGAREQSAAGSEGAGQAAGSEACRARRDRQGHTTAAAGSVPVLLRVRGMPFPNPNHNKQWASLDSFNAMPAV